MSTTEESVPGSNRVIDASESEVLALTIAYCRDEPWRVGEAAIFSETDVELILGRGESERGERRVVFVQQRPGGNIEQPPIAMPTLSRQALKITPRLVGWDDHFLNVRAIPGSRPSEMRVNGKPMAGSMVRPGDTIEIRGSRDTKLLLLCTMRPKKLSFRFTGDEAWPPFGEADRRGVVGESFARWHLLEKLAYAAGTGDHVLLRGPSGSGKEMSALTVHELSRRKNGRFVSRSAATFVDTLIDAELFGNIRNFPNPQTQARPGILGDANGGTLFLDEIGELPQPLQSKLLRCLDANGEYSNLGSTERKRSDVRIIGATNREISELKHDLAPRLKVVVELPGLNDRREDIPLLVQHLAKDLFKRWPEIAPRFLTVDARGHERVRVDPAFIDMLLRWNFDKHVRELDRLVTSAIGESPGNVVEADPVFKKAFERNVFPVEGPTVKRDEAKVEMSEDDMEQYLRVTCDGSYGSKAKAARTLGKSRQQIDRLLEKYGIDPHEADLTVELPRPPMAEDTPKENQRRH